MDNTKLMDNTKHLLLFLYNYDVMHFFGSYQNLLYSIAKSGIPTDLLVMKFFEYSFANNKSVDDIYSILKGSSCDFSDIGDDKKIIQKILGIVGNKEIKFLQYDFLACEEILKLFPVQKIHSCGSESQEPPHYGYPVPDPDLGRPKLEWCVCRHGKCFKQFNSAMALVKHLTECGAFTKGYHYFHENSEILKTLNPEKIIEQNITKCPAQMCHRNSFDSPQDLIKHLKFLGIEPFWTKGTDLTDELTKSEDLSKLLQKSPKLFSNATCVLCLGDPPCIIAGECRHHIFCLECYKEQHNKKMLPQICPMCRNKVDTYYPYA
jgi:hypothetical protein